MTRTVGGTLVSRILGLSKWGGPLSAYFEMVGEPDTTPGNSAMSRGKALEESVLALWLEASGRDPASLLRPERAVRPASMPHAHATLDAYHVTLDIAHDHLLTLPDAKTVSTQEMGEDWGPDGSDRIPVEYQLQLLWYLGVCKAAGMNVADEALLPTLLGPEAELQWAARLVTMTGRPLALADLDGTGLQLRTYRVQWDEALFQEVNRMVLCFLREHVEPRIPPEPGEGDLRERDVRAVARGFKAEPGLVKDFDALGPADQSILLEVLEATRERRKWEKLEEQAISRAQLSLGGAEEVKGLPGGARITWKARQDGVRVFKINEPRGRK
jgi:hypothetical protein